MQKNQNKILLKDNRVLKLRVIQRVRFLAKRAPKLVVHEAERSNCFSINLLIGQKMMYKLN